MILCILLAKVLRMTCSSTYTDIWNWNWSVACSDVRSWLFFFSLLMLTVDSSLEFMSEKEYSFSYQMTQEAVISRKSTIWGSHCMYLQLISYLLKGILIFFFKFRTNQRPANYGEKTATYPHFLKHYFSIIIIIEHTVYCNYCRV